MKHAIIILILIVISLGLGGKSAEVRDRAFVQSISIYHDEFNTYTDIKTFGDTTIYTGEGKDIQSCIDNAQLKQGKDLFTGHTEIVIFQEKDFSFEVLENLIKERTISPNCPVIISDTMIKDTQNALDILKSYYHSGKISITTASDIIKNLTLYNYTNIPLLKEDFSYTTATVNL